LSQGGGGLIQTKKERGVYIPNLENCKRLSREGSLKPRAAAGHSSEKKDLSWPQRGGGTG